MKKLIRKWYKKFKYYVSYTHLRLDTKITCEYLGNDYGGFYVSPKHLKNIRPLVYSFGIGEDVSFDCEIMEKYGAEVWAFDPTPRSIAFIEKKNLSKKFIFTPVAISTMDGEVNFCMPKNEKNISGSLVKHSNVDHRDSITVKALSLNSIMRQNSHTKLDVLKLDIEGSEYDVVENILQTKIPITQIVLEIHDRFFPEKNAKSKKLVRLLREANYKLFAVSQNLEELSFIKFEK